MSFNAKTYDLGSRKYFIDKWNEALQMLEAGDIVWCPVAPGEAGRKVATAYRHQFNRVRSAARIQKELGFLWDHIEVKVTTRTDENGVVWGLEFCDRELLKPNLTFFLEKYEPRES